jgi:hypothetical protein
LARLLRTPATVAAFLTHAVSVVALLGVVTPLILQLPLRRFLLPYACMWASLAALQLRELSMPPRDVALSAGLLLSVAVVVATGTDVHARSRFLHSSRMSDTSGRRASGGLLSHRCDDVHQRGDADQCTDAASDSCSTGGGSVLAGKAGRSSAGAKSKQE